MSKRKKSTARTRPKTRFFANTHGFGDETAYVAITPTGLSYCRLGDGTRSTEGGVILLSFALGAVRRGDWKEVTRKTAEKLVVLKRSGRRGQA